MNVHLSPAFEWHIFSCLEQFMKRGHKRANQGFSMIELLMVIAIVLTLSGMALPQFTAMNQISRANGVSSGVMNQLRAARETAIATRRFVQVTFVGNNQTQFFRLNPGGGPPTALSNAPIPLNSGGQFILFGGETDTPMQFGNAAPIYIGGQSGGPPTMYFTPNGSFVASDFLTLISGTVFLGIPGQPSTARAVTILGGTGRVRQYTWTGSQWIE